MLYHSTACSGLSVVGDKRKKGRSREKTRGNETRKGREGLSPPSFFLSLALLSPQLPRVWNRLAFNSKCRWRWIEMNMEMGARMEMKIKTEMNMDIMLVEMKRW